MADFVRTYWHECVYILKVSLTQEETQEAIEQFRSIIPEQGGGLVKLDELGRRRFTYEIKREREGLYVSMIFWGGAPVVEELNRVLRIDSRVIRHIIVRETKRQFHRRLQDMAKAAAEPAPEAVAEVAPEVAPEPVVEVAPEPAPAAAAEVAPEPETTPTPAEEPAADAPAEGAEEAN